MTERDPAQLADWIRANRAAYTRGALERAMAEQGWSPEAFAAAWAGIAVEDRKAARSASASWLIVVVVLLAALTVAGEANIFPLLRVDPDDLSLPIAVTVAVALLPGAVILAADRRVGGIGCLGSSVSLS